MRNSPMQNAAYAAWNSFYKSGKAVEIRGILDLILAQSGAKIQAETDPAKLRPVDVPVVEADIRRLQEDTGWQRQIPLEQTIRDTLAYWRTELAK